MRRDIASREAFGIENSFADAELLSAEVDELCSRE